MFEYYYLWGLMLGICIYAWFKKEKLYLIAAGLVGIFIIISHLKIPQNIRIWIIVGLSILSFVGILAKFILFNNKK